MGNAGRKVTISTLQFSSECSDFPTFSKTAMDYWGWLKKLLFSTVSCEPSSTPLVAKGNWSTAPRSMNFLPPDEIHSNTTLTSEISL